MHLEEQLTGVEDVQLVDDAIVAAAEDHHEVFDAHSSVSMPVGFKKHKILSSYHAPIE